MPLPGRDFPIAKGRACFLGRRLSAIDADNSGALCGATNPIGTKIMRMLLLASAGGAIGAGARYAVTQWFVAKGWAAYPWATLAINVSGSALMGLTVGMLMSRAALGPELRIFLATGILGGYTTFSAFSLEVWMLAERGEAGAAAAYIAASVALSIAGLGAGLALARLWA